MVEVAGAVFWQGLGLSECGNHVEPQCGSPKNGALARFGIVKALTRDAEVPRLVFGTIEGSQTCVFKWGISCNGRLLL
eukprot:6361217-Pyramimonas_sp.AAC.1